jgi:hypothetical protein
MLLIGGVGMFGDGMLRHHAGEIGIAVGRFNQAAPPHADQQIDPSRVSGSGKG